MWLEFRRVRFRSRVDVGGFARAISKFYNMCILRLMLDDPNYQILIGGDSPEKTKLKRQLNKLENKEITRKIIVTISKNNDITNIYRAALLILMMQEQNFLPENMDELIKNLPDSEPGIGELKQNLETGLGLLNGNTTGITDTIVEIVNSLN